MEDFVEHGIWVTLILREILSAMKTNITRLHLRYLAIPMIPLITLSGKRKLKGVI